MAAACRLGRAAASRGGPRLNHPAGRNVLAVTASEASPPWPLSGEVRWTVKNTLLVGVGVLITVVGIIFALQGVGMIGGSVMTGVTFWAVVGPVIALAGIALATVGLRHRRSAS